MKNIFKEAIEEVRNGARFRVDFKKRNFSLNRKYIIKEGVYEGDLGFEPVENPLRKIEALFDRYQHSVPSERSESKRKRYFNPLPEDELLDFDMMYGLPREVAQVELELYFLMAIMEGNLTWDKMDGKGNWFWKSERYPRLIILKEWLE